MRFLLSVSGAAVISFALLLFMAGLINKQSSQYKSEQETPYFDLLVVAQDDALTRKYRRKPEPPKPQATAPGEVVNDSIAPENMAAVNLDAALDLAALDLSSDITGMAISMPGTDSMEIPAGAQSGESMATPLYRAEPSYPRKALRLGKQGYVVLSFDINEAGRVSNIEVVEAAPQHLFENEAKRALKKWKYKPMLVDGKAVTQAGQKIRLDFRLDS